MASDHSVSQVWLGLLDAERMSRYYQALAVRMQRWHMALTASVAFGSAGAMSSLLLGAPDWVAEVLATAVAAAGVWTFYYGHASKAAMLEVAAERCAELTLDWRDLWARLEGVGDAEAWQAVQHLRRQEPTATTKVPAGLAVRRRLNKKCAEEAYGVWGHEYAVAS